jgi:mannonate dehydratase
VTTIRDIRVITTAPSGLNLVVVKVETSEPGLHGIGCATFTQRYTAVKAAIEHPLKELLIGWDVARIEELFQLMMIQGYWRNGPVMNNAISGVDMALWDIKGKMAGMPVYDVLGGKSREAAAVYRHADGSEPSAVLDSFQKIMADGVHHIRVQCGGYGGVPPTVDSAAPHRAHPPDGSLDGAYYDPRRYMRDALAAIEHVRTNVGDEIEILHDVHERLTCAQAVEFAKEMEQYRLFFLEDLLAPEDVGWYANVRAVCATPQAMGELFCHPLEWTPLIVNRQIDFFRMHMSHIGGLTPARKVAALAEMFGVRSAWHGPGDVSPVGHAANVHLDVVSPNFGIQEFAGFSDDLKEVFPGCPDLRQGYLYPNDQPGLGIDIDEKAAEKFPCHLPIDTWSQARVPDGSLHRP